MRTLSRITNFWKRPRTLKPPVIQPSDKRLRCLVNLKSACRGYSTTASQWADTPLCTDLQARDREDYDAAMAVARTGNPSLPDCRYISGARLQGTTMLYPPEAVLRSACPTAIIDVRNGEQIVKITDWQSRVQFCNAIIDECRRYPGRVILLDNIVHPSADPSWYPWGATCALLHQIRTALNASGKLLIANVAVAAWGMSQADRDRLEVSVDGMAFEMPFDKWGRTDDDRIRTYIAAYRKWLTAGKVVAFIVNPSVFSDKDAYEAEAAFIAQFAMAIREPGDRLFCARAFWQDRAAWETWPEQFGPPSGPWTLDNGLLKRDFQNMQPGQAIRLQCR